jgi:hypothetical protein
MIPGVKRVCLGCGVLTLDGSRCDECRRAKERARSRTRGPRHYTGSYRRTAEKMVAAANADPSTLCRRCGQPARAGDPWTAGHVRAGDPDSPLAPEHASCNFGAGNRSTP